MFKPTTMSASVSYVSIADPAVDWEQVVAAELDADPELRDSAQASHAEKCEIVEKRFQQKLSAAVLRNPADAATMLKYRAGERPTRFVIGVIPPDEMNRIADECKLGQPGALARQAQWRAFVASMRNVEDFPGGPVPKKKVGDVEYVDPAWLRNNFSRGLRDVALDVGFVAWMWNQITEEEIKN